ncbi:MAG TPA: hypothetical protein VGP63_25625 [Planctomycetaceae bacterium]|nr:hypothetical protein [Planctomycetaceae bacterium]
MRECAADDAARVNKIDRSSFEECLAWLPVDTETLRVRRGVASGPLQDEMPKVDQNGFPKIDKAKWGQWAVREIATPSPLAHLRGGKYGVGRQPMLAIAATRYVEIVDPWGGQRYQGCCILQFQDDFGPIGTKLEEDLRKGCKSVRSVAGETVYAFEQSVPRKWYVKDEPWEGTFICRPAPNLLLVATQEAFLETVLKRRCQKVSDRALPDNLPFWKNVDVKSSAWMVRHIKRKSSKQTIGVAWSLAASKSSPGIVLTFSHDDLRFKAARDWAATRILERATAFGFPASLKKSPQTAILSIEWPKPDPNEPPGPPSDNYDPQLVSYSFFLVSLESDPVVIGEAVGAR